jgi:hypothetical protein
MSQPKFKKTKRGGFISIVLIVVAALVLIKYVYNIDIVGFLTTGRFRGLLDQFYKLGSEGWSKYSETLIRVWNYIFEFLKNILAKAK